MRTTPGPFYGLFHGKHRLPSPRLFTLLKAQDRLCAYCGEIMLIGVLPREAEYRRATIDHVIPLAKGGSRHAHCNQVAACYACNQAKGDMMPEEFAAHRDSGSRRDGEDARSGAEAEGRQNGSRSEIARDLPA